MRIKGLRSHFSIVGTILDDGYSHLLDSVTLSPRTIGSSVPLNRGGKMNGYEIVETDAGNIDGCGL